MNQIVFILMILLLGTVAVGAGRRIRMLQQARLTGAATSEVAARGGATEQQPVLAERFRQWTQQAFASDPKLLAWLNSLGESALEAFTREIAAFTKEARIDLHWLLEQDLSYHPVTRDHLTAMLLHYCQAWYYAVNAQQEAKVLQIWAQFNQNPDAPQHQPLRQALWVQLVEQQLAPPATEMLVAPSNEQQAYMVQAIRNVAQKEPVRFYALLPNAVATAELVPAASLTQQVEEMAQRLWALRPTRKAATANGAAPQKQETTTATGA